MIRYRVVFSTIIAVILISAPLWAAESEDEQAELAKKLANPIASLISVPIQANYDENIGLNEEGSQWKVNIQPVIPFSMSEDWNIITRTILSLIDQDDIPVSKIEENYCIIDKR